MALKQCKECGKQISTQATSCPNCGAVLKKKTGVFTWIVAIFFILFMLGSFGTLFNKYSDKTPEVSPSPLSSTNKADSDNTFRGYTFNGYTLNDRERSVLKAMFIMDFDSLMNGSEAILSPLWEQHLNVINVTSDKLQSDYENNEVAGDQQYRGKALLVSGIVMSINRGIGENYYVCLNGGSNMFIQPHARMSEGDKNYLANLQKGQTITLVCMGNGMLMGSAILNQCVPTRNLAEALIDVSISKGEITDQFSKGQNVVQMFIATSIAIASTLQKSSYCYGTDFGKDMDRYNKCTAEIRNAIDEKTINKTSLKIAAGKLKLDFDKIKKMKDE